MPLTLPTVLAVARFTKQTRDTVMPQKILILAGGSATAAFLALMDREEMVVVMESHRVTMDRNAVNRNTTSRTAEMGMFLKKANTADSVPSSCML